jgi:hypothetical protein
VLSAESLGRGRTTAANLASPAAGSENPAALNDGKQNVSYATAIVGMGDGSVPKEAVRQNDALRDKTLQYFSMQGEKGVIFYEPLSRFDQVQSIDNVPGGINNVDYQANALGVAGAETWGKGSFGLSLAYLWSSLASTMHVAGQPDQSHLDTSDGVRLNFGFRQPTGPLMWGVVFQNMPGFLWGSSYKRQMLPPSVRVGNTWRAYPGILFSVDWERRFYNEGGHAQNLLYIGSEIFSGDSFVLRVGAFGTNLDQSDKRHFTAGIGYRPHPGLEISYAYERYEIDDLAVNRSVVSLKYPFDTTVEEPAQR